MSNPRSKPLSVRFASPLVFIREFDATEFIQERDTEFIQERDTESIEIDPIITKFGPGIKKEFLQTKNPLITRGALTFLVLLIVTTEQEPDILEFVYTFLGSNESARIDYDMMFNTFGENDEDTSMQDNVFMYQISSVALSFIEVDADKRCQSGLHRYYDNYSEHYHYQKCSEGDYQKLFADDMLMPPIFN